MTRQARVLGSPEPIASIFIKESISPQAYYGITTLAGGEAVDARRY